MKLLRRSFIVAMALAGFIPAVSICEDMSDLQDPTDSAATSVNSERNAERLTLFDRDSEPLDEVVIGNWIAKVDYLNWTVNRQGLDFAVTTDGTAQAVGNGSVRNLDFGQASGVRAGIGYLFPSGWDLTGSYTYFRNTASAFAREPAGGNLWATLSHPNVNQEAETADASATFDYDVFDLEAGYGILLTDAIAIRPFAGLRWANIDQDLIVRYDGRDFNDAVVSNTLAMNGFGFRLGMDGNWYVGRGLSLFGRAAGSVLYGSFESRLRETNFSGADTIVNVRDNYTQAVPVLETAMGAAWEYNQFQVAGGYELNNWFNLANRSMFPDNVHEGAYAPMSENVLLHGFFIRCSILY